MPVPTPTAHLRLLTGPAGSGKTRRALARVKEAATTTGARGRGASRPGDALLVLPTYAQAMHLSRVALSLWDARAVLDGAFQTFTSVGEHYLDGFRVRALPSLVERDATMDEALRRADAPAFRAVRDRPGLRARLLRLVKEVKQSGLDPEAARERLAASADRLAPDARARLLGFVEVFTVYDRLLDAAGLEDHEDTLSRLARALDEGPLEGAPALLVVDGFDDFTPVEDAILDALARIVADRGGEVVVTLPWDAGRPDLFGASAETRRRLLTRGFVEEPVAGFARAPGGPLARLALDLFRRDPPAPAAHPGEEVRLVLAGDPEDEAEAVAREARRLDRVPGLLRGWRDLVVVARRLDEAGPRILDALSRLGVPARLVGAGRPLASEALVRALAGPLSLLSGRTGPGELDATGLVPWFRWRAHADGGPALSARVDRFEIACRRYGWPRDLDQLASAARAAGLDPEPLVTHRRELASAAGWGALGPRLAKAVLELAPLPPAAGLDRAGRPIDPEADHRRARAAAARDRVLGLVAGLAGAALRTGIGTDVDARRAVDLLLDAVEQARLALPDRRLDAVNVFDFEEARHWEAPVVIVAGLSEGEVPLVPREDVVLGDDDRESVHGAAGFRLPLARDRETRERRLFYGAVTRARRRLVLVRSTATPDGDPRPPSLFLEQVERTVRLSEATVSRPAGRPAPARSECYTPRDLALFAAETARDPGASPDDQELARALLATGDPDLLRRAARARVSGGDPLEPARSTARFRAAVARVSASTLRDAIACRRRVFFRQVLGAPEDAVPFAGPPFGPRERGTLVHDALRRALAEPAKAPAVVARETIEASASRRGSEVGALGEAERVVLLGELQRLAALLRARVEAGTGLVAPCADGLELAFGEDDGFALDTPGGPLRLRGRIDRVDRGEGRAVVVDYKLSATSARDAHRLFGEGLDPQLPLYAAVVHRMYGVEVVGIEWLAATERVRFGVWCDGEAVLAARAGEGGRVDRRDPAAFRAALAAVVERAGRAALEVGAGAHDRQTEDAKRCGTCAWRPACRPVFARVEDADDAEETTS